MNIQLSDRFTYKNGLTSRCAALLSVVFIFAQKNKYGYL